MVERSIDRDRLDLVGLGALYVIGHLLLVSLYPLAVNPDATAYLNLAEHYVDGDLAEAVVSHWAPLYTWLIAPALALGIQPVIAAAIVQAAFGIAALIACWLLLDRLSVRGWIRSLTCLALIPLLLRYSYSPLGPDLLIATIYLGLLLLLIDTRWSPGLLWMPVAAGILVGLAYLAKGTAALGVTLLPLIVAYLLRWRRGSGAVLAHARGLAIVLLTAGGLVAPWAVAISLEEDKPTLGTSAAYSLAVVGPAREGIHPTESDGLLEPPHPRAVSAWEDPARLDVERWSPWEDPGYALKRFVANIARYGSRGLESVPFAGLLALLALYVIRSERRHLAWALVGFGLLIPIAYSPVLTQERYAWASYLLVVVLAGMGVAEFVIRRSLGPRVATGVLFVVVLSNATLAARQLDVDGLEIGRAERRVADSLRDLEVTKVAANGEWHVSLGSTFLADDQFFGIPRRGQSAVSIGRELDKMNIDGFLLWGTPRRRPEYLREFTRGPSKSVDGTTVTVFAMKQGSGGGAMPRWPDQLTGSTPQERSCRRHAAPRQCGRW